MEIFVINDSEDLNRVSSLKSGGKHNIFVDITRDFGIIVDKSGDKETTLAFKLYDKTNNASLAVLEKFISDLSDHIFFGIENKLILFIDAKNTIKNVYNNYDKSYKNIIDIKIVSILEGNHLAAKISQLDNFCDFTTFLESRKNIYTEIQKYYFNVNFPEIYSIMINSIDPYIEIENHGLAFDKIDSNVLNSLDARNGKLYFNYNLTGTITGRTSSKIHPLSKEIKKNIKPSKGNIFVNFDYNAGEARVLAHYSEDEDLIDIFKQDNDLHKINAALIFGKKSEEEVTNQERMVSKLVFFSIINGVSTKTLSDDLKKFKIESTKVNEIKSALQKIYKKSFSWLNQVQTDALSNKTVTNMFGRTRYLSEEIKESETKARRQASNAIIQSTLSDVKLIALNDIHKKYKGILAAEFHDAILIEIEINDKVNGIISDICNIMAQIGERYKFKCPLKVNYEAKEHL